MEKQIPAEKNNTDSRGRTRYVVSATLPDGSLAEAVLKPDEQRTVFCVWKDGGVRYADKLTDGEDILLPYSARNNLLRNEVVRLPSQPVAYDSERALLGFDPVHDRSVSSCRQEVVSPKVREVIPAQLF